MNRMLNNRTPQKKAKGKKGCLFVIAGAMATILATTLVCLFLVPAATGAVIEARHGGTVAYALMTAQTASIPFVLSFFTGIFGLWYFAPTEEELRARNRNRLAPTLGEPEARAMSTATKLLISGAMLLGVVLTGFVAANSYRLVTNEGISTYFFVETKSYEWKQVSAYTVDCDGENGLSITFTMRDGKQYEILQGVNSATKEFKEKYTSVTHFAADIDEEMVALQVPRNVRHMEKAVNFYKSYEGLWPYVSKIIGYAELVPEPDETVEETESATEALTTAETN